ncbi:tetratricopeptide repeat-containing hybrid sensor histidine kinase/response regulator [Flavobacterium cheniae]|uniref:histidine kinase n=1 Tax=Flavobacterium cheniae TaxID=295428 RepID=A0A562KEZ8_9FLAO|nr:ATP-binding protein [Flavobacterium cheniae]TDR26172.1 phospho-acceptor domain-containing protein [Flavobacterium cheniae]TWH93904.1 phospho-acceptor domain-containing protein [Flavobacterium cheniae]
MFKKAIVFFCLLFFFQLSFGQGIGYKDKYARGLYDKALKGLNDLKCSESLLYSQQLLEYALKRNKYDMAAASYNIIGLNFEEFGDLKKSIQYYNSGVSYAQLAKNDTIENYLYNNIGNLYYFRLKDSKKGLYYYQKSYELSKRLDAPRDIAFAEINLADVYLELNEFDKGKYYLQLVEKKMSPDDYEMGMSYYSLMGYYYEIKGDFVNAEKNYLKCISDFQHQEFEYHKSHQMDIYAMIYAFYKKNKKTEQALYYLEKHDQLQDELFSKERNIEIKMAGGDIEALEYKYKVQQIETEKRIQEQKMKASSRFNKVVLWFLGFVIVFLIFIFKGFVNYRNLSKKLSDYNFQLQVAREKSEEATRLKTQFLSNVSHELRTPLYGVIGMAEILESEHKEIKKSPYFNALKFSSHYLLTLINDVLNVYKIEDNDIEFNYENINVREEIGHIKESMNVIAKSNKNEIIVSIADDVPQYIKTDLTRFSQILINLASNSLKFTKKGKVTISLSLDKVNDNSFLKLEVLDTGIGIPEEYIDKIFEKFVQVDVNLQEQYKGTGLGLSIVKRLVELFKGSISVESKINEGSKFTVMFPHIPADEIVASDQLKTHSQKKLKNLNILVVEDNKINQMVTKKLLEKNGHSYQMAENGLEALQLVEQNTFDIILMDINMPVMNGIEASIKMRNLGIKTPIIALTASDKENILKEILEKKNGLTDVLVKPFEYSDLENVISRYI